MEFLFVAVKKYLKLATFFKDLSTSVLYIFLHISDESNA
jgi:hypothetical protein